LFIAAQAAQRKRFAMFLRRLAARIDRMVPIVGLHRENCIAHDGVWALGIGDRPALASEHAREPGQRNTRYVVPSRRGGVRPPGRRRRSAAWKWPVVSFLVDFSPDFWMMFIIHVDA
jgi:hypothetical protein